MRKLKIREDGVYIPDNIVSNTEYPPVFAIDNLDWFKKTLQGGSFNATSSIIIQNVDNDEQDVDLQTFKLTSSRKRSMTPDRKPDRPPFFVSPPERKRARSLTEIPAFENLKTDCDSKANDLFLLWQIGRCFS